MVNKIIENYFSDIINIDFTATLEQELDEIEESKRNWVEIIDNFYQPFSKEVSNAEVNMASVQIKDEPAGLIVRYVDLRWSLRWVSMGNFMPVLDSLIVEIHKQLLKR
nr:hypothetical protein [Apilactobacillus ozensis]